MVKRKPTNLGPLGERAAEADLVARGFVILERNLRLKSVEFDLVARRNDETWFVEVKTRSDTRFGMPYEFISAEKRARMESGALEYLESRGESDAAHRLVAASIVLRDEVGTPEITWLPLEER
jgi:putative endonuclease